MEKKKESEPVVADRDVVDTASVLLGLLKGKPITNSDLKRAEIIIEDEDDGEY